MTAASEAWNKLKIIRRQLVELTHQIEDVRALLDPDKPVDLPIVHTALNVWGDSEWRRARGLMAEIRERYPLFTERRIGRELERAGFQKRRDPHGILYAKPPVSLSADASGSGSRLLPRPD